MDTTAVEEGRPVHPGLAAAMSVAEPVASRETAWAGGAMPLRVFAYVSTPELPLDLVSSVRCIVWVGDRLVFCENPDGRHPWPGGRRIEGESYADTAARKVHEETGWRIDKASLRQIGWLRLTHRGPMPAANAGPYPDFLQVVFTARAAERDGGPDVAWTDTDGYELTSSLVTLADAAARTSTDMLANVFLDRFHGPDTD
jgi:ADP-ribose pyrophosphatase YjhB (NUDIX family)